MTTGAVMATEHHPLRVSTSRCTLHTVSSQDCGAVPMAWAARTA